MFSRDLRDAVSRLQADHKWHRRNTRDSLAEINRKLTLLMDYLEVRPVEHAAHMTIEPSED